MSESATKTLRRLLDERGVEWEDGDAAYEIEWSTPDGRYCSAMYWKPTFSVLISHCTPEQAIAATLGKQNVASDQESIVRSFLRKISPNRDWDYLGEHEHALIADLVDEIAATLGSEREKTLEKLAWDMWCEITTCPDYRMPPCMTESICERVRELEIGVDQ